MEGKARVDAEADVTGTGVGWGHAGVGGLPDVPSVNLEALIRLAKVIETGSGAAWCWGNCTVEGTLALTAYLQGRMGNHPKETGPNQ